MSVPLTEKVALITGAGQGIGQGIAFSLAKRGVRVIAVGRTLEKCEHTCTQIAERFGTESRALECDIGNLDTLDALVSEAHNCFERIDILVNNAVSTRPRPLMKQDRSTNDVSLCACLSDELRRLFLEKFLTESLRRQRTSGDQEQQ